ncbi:MAG: hypothetical protein ABWY55_09800 [Microbacterium sp.]
MDYSTSVGYRLQQQEQQERTRTLELRRRIAERHQALEGVAPTPAPVRAQGWRNLLVRVHMVHPLPH